MKILMIAPQPFFTPRGTPFSVYYRTRVLAALGHHIDLLTYPMGQDARIPGVQIIRSMKVPGIRTVKIGPSINKFILDFFLFCKAFSFLVKGRYEIIHAHEEAVFFCLVFRIFFGVKVVYDMHSSLPEQLQNFKFSRNPWLIRIFSWLERRSIQMADLVITICPHLQAQVEALKLDTPAVLIENSLCDPVALADDAEELHPELIRWEQFDGRKMVLYSGTFEPYQGLNLLIDGIPQVLRDAPSALFVLLLR